MLYILQIIIFVIAIILSFILNRKNEFKVFNIKQHIKNINKKQALIILITIVIISMQIILSSYLYTSNADDSLYVSWSEQAKNLEQYLDSDPSLGQETSNFPKMYSFNSW